MCRYKYVHMEEMLGNVPGSRQIFERWMSFEPDHHGWMAYIKVRLCRSGWRVQSKTQHIRSGPSLPRLRSMVWPQKADTG